MKPQIFALFTLVFLIGYSCGNPGPTQEKPNFVFILVDAYLVTMILPEIPMFDFETISALIPTLGSLLIWTPYLFLSKRSKETFIL